MPKKLDLTPEERIARKREQDRLRFKKYYENNKSNPEYIAKRKSYKEKDKELRKEIPSISTPIHISTHIPISTHSTHIPTTPSKILIRSKKTGKSINSYPIMNVKEVQDFMKNNKEFVLKRNKEPLSERTLKDYISGISGLAKVIQGTDNFIGAFYNYKKTIDLIKKNKTYTKNGVDIEYKPSRFQTWLEFLFSSIRCLKRAGKLEGIKNFDEIMDKYDSFYQEFLVKRALNEKKNVENPDYALPNWNKFNKNIVDVFGKISIENLITTLYRYNAIRNDYVKLKIVDNPTQEGFYLGKSRTSNVRIFKNKPSKAGEGSIDFTYNKEASNIIREYITINNLKIGDTLLPSSINNIVKNMFSKTGIKHPSTAKPISVFRNIDSVVADINNIDTTDLVEKAKRSKHSINTRLNIYMRSEKKD